MSTPTGQALEQRQMHPANLLQRQYSDRLAALVPSHVNGEAWVRQATGTLRDEKLAAAARNDFASFVGAVEKAAVLGLRPGTEEFYLIPRKEKGQLQVQGIVGYQGLVDLMYRSGAVASVVVEVVRDNDEFGYAPGLHEVPVHHVDWKRPEAERGDLALAYAYARMTSGAVSKVVILNRDDIARIKASSDGASSSYSPWQKHEKAMWLKSAARQLAKWVPTSTEYIAQQAQARAVGAAIVSNAQPAAAALPAPAPAAIDAPPVVNMTTGELLDDDGIGYDPTTEPGFGEG